MQSRVIIGYVIMIILIIIMAEFVGLFIKENIIKPKEMNEWLNKADMHEDWARDLRKHEIEVSTNTYYAKYEPYITYRHKPYTSTYLNINEDGLRYTWNDCAKENATKIFFFGGSAIWGYGSRDNYTIPSIVTKKLCEKGYNIHTTNFGELGRVNTDEMIDYFIQLRDNKPDIVIFYDGFNDIYSAYNGNVCIPMGSHNREFEFNKRGTIDIVEYLKTTMIGLTIVKIMTPPKTYHPELIDDAVECYKNNIRIIDTVNKEYNIKGFYLWQPSMSAYTSKINMEMDGLKQYLYLKMYSLMRYIQMKEVMKWLQIRL